LRPWYDYLGLSLLGLWQLLWQLWQLLLVLLLLLMLLLLLLRIPLMHLHLHRRVSLRKLRRLAMLLVAVGRLRRRVWVVGAIWVAVLLIVPRIHDCYGWSSEVKSPGIVLGHDMLGVCSGAVNATNLFSRDVHGRRDEGSRGHMH
jgi:hypothetical protein